jgi:hypothetical protein
LLIDRAEFRRAIGSVQMRQYQRDFLAHLRLVQRLLQLAHARVQALHQLRLGGRRLARPTRRPRLDRRQRALQRLGTQLMEASR